MPIAALSPPLNATLKYIMLGVVKNTSGKEVDGIVGMRGYTSADSVFDALSESNSWVLVIVTSSDSVMV
jgi:hypothetical protein